MAENVEYEYRFLIDWGGDDALGRADRVSASGLPNDITADIVRAELKLGRDDTDTLAGVSSGGAFRATLNNYDDIYNIYGWAERHGTGLLPLPGRDITVVYRPKGSGLWKRLWRGFLLEVKQMKDHTLKSTVEVTGEGPLAYVQSRGYSIAFNPDRYPNYLTSPPVAGTVIFDLLSERPPRTTKPIWPVSRRHGWSGGQAGETKIDVVKLFDALGSGRQLQNPYSVIQQLVKSEFGYIFDDREGNINFRDRYWRVASATPARPGNAARIDEEHIRALTPGNGLENIYNRAVSDATSYEIYNDELISKAIKVATTSDTEVELTYDAMDWDPELEDGEFIAAINDIKVEVEPDVTFVVTTRYYKQELTVKVSNLPGTHAVRVNVTEANVKTSKLFEQFDLTAENLSSINAIGTKEYRFPSKILWYDPDPAKQDSLGVPLDIVILRAYLQYIVNIYGSFTKNMKLQYKVRHQDALLNSSIGELILVNSPTNDINEELFFIETERHIFTNKGIFDHDVELTLVEAEPFVTPWDLLDEETNLDESALYY